MSLFNRVMAEAYQYSDEYRERPFDLPEKSFVQALKGGLKHSPEHGIEIEPLKDFEAQSPKFVKMQQDGWMKHHAVLRVNKSDPYVPPTPGAKKKKKKAVDPTGSSRAVAVHFWEHPDGRRSDFKFVSQSPHVTRTEGRSLFDRIM